MKRLAVSLLIFGCAADPIIPHSVSLEDFDAEVTVEPLDVKDASVFADYYRSPSRFGNTSETELMARGLDLGVFVGEALPEEDAGPSREYCNGIDDDWDGQTDEGVLNACGECGATPTEVLGGLADEDCDGHIDEGFLGGYCETWSDCASNGDDLGMDCTDNVCTKPCVGCQECNLCIQRHVEEVREDGQPMMLPSDACHDNCQHCLNDCNSVSGVCAGNSCQMRREEAGGCREDQDVFQIFRQWFVEGGDAWVDVQFDNVTYCRTPLW